MYQELQPEKFDYLIVEFPEEVTEDKSIPMAVISSSWVIEQNKNIMCYWPIYIKSTTKREKAVIYHEALQKDKCTLCPISVKYSADNYDVAVVKLRALEEAQDSQTESEFEKTERTHKPKKYSDFDYSSDDNEETPPVAPRLPQPLKLKIKEKDNNLQFSAKMQEQISHPSNLIQKKQPDNSQSMDVSLNSLAPVSSCKNSFLEHQKKISSLAPPLQKSKKVPAQLTSSSFTSVLSGDEGSCHTCKNNEGVLEELVKAMEKLQEDIKFLIQLNQEKDSQFIGSYENESFKSIDELGKFEKDLSDDEEYFQKTCIRLSLVGGRDGATTTRKILATIIAHSLALNLNWSGRNDKGGLKDYTFVIKCIACAVRRNPNSKNFTNDDVQGSVKASLRNAADRDGGRSKRTNK